MGSVNVNYRGATFDGAKRHVEVFSHRFIMRLTAQGGPKGGRAVMEEGREKGRCKSPQRGVAASCGFSTLNPYRGMRINQKKASARLSPCGGANGQRPTLPPQRAVPSALAGLTSLFGMGRGETPPL